MHDPQFGWRDENRRISISSVVLLVVFVGAVVATVYLGLVMKPWASDEAGVEDTSVALETPVPGESPLPTEAAPVPPQ